MNSEVSQTIFSKVCFLIGAKGLYSEMYIEIQKLRHLRQSYTKKLENLH